jgi:enoyl-CoA hydratase/carnithine racemase
MREAKEHVLVERPEEGIALVRLNRPERLNALTDAMLADIDRRLADFAAETATRAVILTGAGRGFCAGFDLDHAATAPGEDDMGTPRAWTRRQEAFAGIVTRLRSLPQPVIAAVNGPANGAGFGMALAAEVRVAARSARFNAAFLKVGMSGCDIGVSWLLPRHVGLSRAFELLLTGRMVDAEEADRMGFVSAVVDDADLLPRALQMARAIAANSAFGVWLTKRGVWANAEIGSLQAAIDLENRTQMLARTTGEFAAAAAAFKARSEKRS